jgi:hypothetical protein
MTDQVKDDCREWIENIAQCGQFRGNYFRLLALAVVGHENRNDCEYHGCTANVQTSCGTHTTIHSARNVVAGSTLEALPAGIAQARPATMNNKTTTPT